MSATLSAARAHSAAVATAASLVTSTRSFGRRRSPAPIGCDSERGGERLRQRASRATKVPNAGRVVPEFARSDVREVFVRSYRIVYRVVDADIVILTVFEGHKLLGELDLDADA